jgi:hypothetical protein
MEEIGSSQDGPLEYQCVAGATFHCTEGGRQFNIDPSVLKGAYREDRLKIPCSVKQEFGKTALVIWNKQVLGATIVAPHTASGKAQADWLKMHDKSMVNTKWQ